MPRIAPSESGDLQSRTCHRLFRFARRLAGVGVDPVQSLRGWWRRGASLWAGLVEASAKNKTMFPVIRPEVQVLETRYFPGQAPGVMAGALAFLGTGFVDRFLLGIPLGGDSDARSLQPLRLPNKPSAVSPSSSLAPEPVELAPRPISWAGALTPQEARPTAGGGSNPWPVHEQTGEAGFGSRAASADQAEPSRGRSVGLPNDPFVDPFAGPSDGDLTALDGAAGRRLPPLAVDSSDTAPTFDPGDSGAGGSSSGSAALALDGSSSPVVQGPASPPTEAELTAMLAAPPALPPARSSAVDTGNPSPISVLSPPGNQGPPPASDVNSARAQTQSQAQKSFNNLPVRFEPNLGQHTSPVQFHARGQGFEAYLTANEMVLALTQPGTPSLPKDKTPLPSPNAYVIRMQVVGANPSARITGQGRLRGTSSYFLGNSRARWVRNVPNYSQVLYQDVYPGIDLLFRGNDYQQLEYDFTVNPGANPSTIQLGFTGPSTVSLDRVGNLVLHTAFGDVVEQAPSIYQVVRGVRRTVPGRYVLQDATHVAFQVGSYNHSLPLVIDPVLGYSTYLGGSAWDEGDAITVDSQGDTFIAGKTFSTDFPGQPFSGPTPTQPAIFVTELDPTGQPVYSAVFGGTTSGFETSAGGVATDGSGNTYVTGSTDARDFPTTTGAYRETDPATGHPHAFLSELSYNASSGVSLAYSTYLGGTADDYGNALAVDSHGNAYLTGRTSSADFPHTLGAFQTGKNQDSTDQAFVTKLNPAGGGGADLVYSTYLGGGSTKNTGNGIAVDASGNIFVTGATDAGNFPTTPGAVQLQNNAGPTFVSTNGGSNWALLKPGIPSSRYITSFAADGSDNTSSTLYVGTDSGVYKLTNGAPSWVLSGLMGEDVTALVAVTINGTPNLVAGAARTDTSNGGLFRSTDGVNWDRVTNGIPAQDAIDSLAVYPTNPPTIYAGTSAGQTDFAQVYQSTDGGAHWSQEPPLSSLYDIYAIAVDSSNGTIYVSTYYGLVSLACGTCNWEAGGFISAKALAVDPNDHYVYALASAPGGGIWRSTDGGTDFTNLNGVPMSGLRENVRANAIVIDFSTNPSTIYVGTDSEALGGQLQGGTVVKSTNEGDSWTVLGQSPQDGDYVTALTLDPHNASTLYAASTRAATNAFLTKIVPAGAGSQDLAYSTYLGGNGAGGGSGIALGGSGGTDQPANVYLVGSTNATNFPTQNPYQPSKKGIYNNAVVAKLSVNADGSSALAYSTYLGGANSPIDPITQGNAIAVDGSGNMYVTGYTIASDFPTALPLTGAFQSTSAAYVTELSPSGNGAGHGLVFSSRLGGSGADQGSAIAVAPGTDPTNPDEDIYLTGYTSSTDFPTVNAFQPARDGNGDAFVTKIELSALNSYVRTSDPQQGQDLSFGPATYSSQLGNLQVQIPLDFRQTNNSALLDAAVGLDGAPALVYNSDTVTPRSIVEINYVADPSAPVPADPGFQVHLTWNGTVQPEVDFGTQNHQPGDSYVFAVQAASAVTKTGVYPWTVEVDATYPDQTPPLHLTASGSTLVVVNGSDGTGGGPDPLGFGWSLAGLDYLYVPPDGSGAWYVSGTHGSRFFTNPTHQQPPPQTVTYGDPTNDFGTLIQDGTTYAFTYTTKDQTVLNFGPPDSTTNISLLTSVVDPHGLAVTYTYNPGQFGQLTGVAEPDGGLATFQYSNGYLTNILEPGGRTVTVTVDGSHNLTGLADVDNSTAVGNDLRTFTYDPAGSHRLMNDQWGTWNTTYSYEPASSALMTINRGHDSVVTTDTTLTIRPANIQGLVTSPAALASQVQGAVTDALGHTTSYALDPLGRLTQEQRPGLPPETWQRDSAGQVVAYTDALGNQTTYWYRYGSNLGDLAEIDYPDGAVQQYTYQPQFHKVQTATDPDTNVTTYNYDGTTGDLLSVQTADLALTTYSYFQDGNGMSLGLLNSVEDAHFHLTTYSFETDKRLLDTVTAADNGITTYQAYDAFGDPYITVYPLNDTAGRTVTTNYDAKRRLLNQANPDGGMLTMAYNAQGQETSVKNPRGYTTSYNYDTRGFLRTTVEDPTGFNYTATTVYDQAGNLLDQTDPRGTTTSYGYDADNRPNLVIDAFGQPESRSATMLYDANDNLLSETTGISPTVTYAHRSVTTYQYDARNRPTVVIETPDSPTSTMALRTTTTYDPAGNVLTVERPPANGTVPVVTHYGYDALNRVNQIDEAYLRPEQSTTTLLYDSVGDLYSVTTGIATDPAYAHHVETRYDYDPVHRRRQEVADYYGEHVSTATRYDYAGDVIGTIDARGVGTSYGYDWKNDVVTITEAATVPMGIPAPPYPVVTTLQYDPAGNLVGKTDPRNVGTSYSYDSLNRLTQTVEAANAPSTLPALNHPAPITTYLYDPDSNLTAVVDPRKVVTSYVYDRLNRRTQVVEAPIVQDGSLPTFGYTTATTYDAADNAVQVTDPRGISTTALYDFRDRVVDQTTAAGTADASRTTLLYDGEDNLVALTNPRQVVTTYLYDALNRQVQRTEAAQAPAGLPTLNHARPVTRTTYDAAGNVLSVTDPLRHTSTYTYDGLDRRTQAQDARDGLTTTLYDPAGNLTQVQDPDGNITTMVYDALNRLVQRTDPKSASLSATFAYDAGDHLISTTDRLQRRIDYRIDALGRVAEAQWYTAPPAPVLVNDLTYRYDADGDLLQAGDNHSLDTFSYDAVNRPTSQRAAYAGGLASYTLSAGYDGDGNRTMVLDTIQGMTTTSGGTTTSTYDSQNRLSSRSFVGTNPAQALRVDLGYTPTGGLATLTRFQGVGSTTPIGTTLYADDALDRVANVTSQSANTSVVSSSTYVYDAASRLLSEWNRLQGTGSQDRSATVAYSYDDINELRSERVGTGAPTTYQYDPAGNRQAAGTYTYATPASGNRLTADGAYTYVYDAEGNLTAKRGPNDTEVWGFTYDHRDQLTSATKTVNGSVVMQATYVYDVFGNRIEKDVSVNGGPTVVQRYAYDGQTLFADLDGNGDLQVRYVRGDGADQVFAQLGAGADAWLWTDVRGSVRDLVSLAGAYQMGSHVEYDAYGNTDTGGGRAGTRLGYTGQEYDAETGLQLNKQRYYDAKAGRWTSEDPIGFGAGDPNLYRYVGNNPTDNTDPSGLFDDKVFWDNVETIAEQDDNARLALDWYRRKGGQYKRHNRSWWNPIRWGRQVGAFEDDVPVIYIHSGYDEADAARAFYKALTEQYVRGFADYTSAEKIGLPEYDNAVAYQEYLENYLRVSAGIVGTAAHGILSIYAQGGGGWILTVDDAINGHYLSAAIGALPVGAAATVKVVSKEGQVLGTITGKELRGLRSEYRAAKGTAKGFKAPATTPRTARYGTLRNELAAGEQANHLNQNAAFRDVIPEAEGLSVGLRGNAFTEVGSAHYEFHRSLEGFWNQFRRGGARFGQTPTNAEYGQALEQALRAGGLSPADAASVAAQAAQQRAAYGLAPNAPVPRIPGRINQTPPPSP